MIIFLVLYICYSSFSTLEFENKKSIPFESNSLSWQFLKDTKRNVMTFFFFCSIGTNFCDMTKVGFIFWLFQFPSHHAFGILNMVYDISS